MLKKKDKLLEILKNTQRYPVLQFLSIEDLQQLALTKKIYYMQLLSEIKTRQLDQEKFNFNSKNDNKKTKKTNKKEKPNCNPDSDGQQIQVSVQIQKFSIYKWPKDLDNMNWQKIDKLHIHNKYLEKKVQSKCYVFYQNKETKDLIYINRSFVDPNLSFQKGSFNQQLYDDIYEHMYEQNDIELDFSSREMLLKRQKQMLQKINKKKAQNAQKDIISYEKQLQKAINMNRYAIILCFGGSFSLAIFEKSKCINHRSDKKYVCRKKAGERQWTKDKQSGSSIKSMGSQIRRDQQKKHVINVNEILNQNREQLFKCEIIFLQAPGMNRLYIINENQTMAELQQKLRSVCLTAKKANFTEVQLINESINTVHLVRVNNGNNEIKQNKKGKNQVKPIKQVKQEQAKIIKTKDKSKVKKKQEQIEIGRDVNDQ